MKTMMMEKKSRRRRRRRRRRKKWEIAMSPRFLFYFCFLFLLSVLSSAFCSRSLSLCFALFDLCLFRGVCAWRFICTRTARDISLFAFSVAVVLTLFFLLDILFDSHPRSLCHLFLEPIWDSFFLFFSFHELLFFLCVLFYCSSALPRALSQFVIWFALRLFLCKHKQPTHSSRLLQKEQRSTRSTRFFFFLQQWGLLAFLAAVVAAGRPPWRLIHCQNDL